METIIYPVILSKPAKRQLRDKVISSQFASLLASVNTKSLKVQGWVVEDGIVFETGQSWRQRNVTVQDNTGDAEYIYEYFLDIAYNGSKEQPRHMLDSILRTIQQKASQPSIGSWNVVSVAGESYTPPADGEVTSSTQTVAYTDVAIPDDWEDNFSHLFGLDPHIERIKVALEAGIISGWVNRFNVVLQGPPGCGKSDICRSVKRALGDDAVMEFDATATTAAGAIKELSELEILPRVLIVEEIEKADEKALSFLLGVLDLRGEIRKTTARNTIQRDTKLFCIATVNNVELFNRLQAGALASRFSNKIWFRRPSREQVAMILTREIDKVNGDYRWITPVLDYADKHDITDPRMLTALCLCGRDKWLTGEYEVMLSATGDPGEIESTSF